MYNTWDVDLSDSAKAIDKIKEDILPVLINGKIHSIEDSKNEVLLLFDQYAGIDYLRNDSVGLQGIAARVQWGNAWNTFTIREQRHTGNKTELSKRLEQIEKGYFYPYLTLQAYFDNRIDNNLLSIAVIKTIDLYDYVLNGSKIQRRKSDNLFVYISWTDVKDKIKYYPKDVKL